jgi:hypothetical protein
MNTGKRRLLMGVALTAVVLVDVLRGYGPDARAANLHKWPVRICGLVLLPGGSPVVRGDRAAEAVIPLSRWDQCQPSSTRQSTVSTPRAYQC